LVIFDLAELLIGDLQIARFVIGPLGGGCTM